MAEVLRKQLALVLLLVSTFLGSLPDSPLGMLRVEATGETVVSRQVCHHTQVKQGYR